MSSLDTNVSCRLLEEKELPAWDNFVSGHPEGSLYHLSVWRHILGEAFGKQWRVVAAVHQGRVFGGIPLVHMRSALFGNFLVSMPYVNYGGVLVDQDNLLDPLFQAAKRFGEQLNVEYIEFRHLRNHYSGLPTKSEKVSMWFRLPDSSEKLLPGFKAKLRSQVRKGEKNGLMVQCGREELLNEFYSVFAQNMKELGTPVYGKKIFRLILEAFPKTARVVVVTNPSHNPIAGGFLIGYRDRMEIPWASSLRTFNHLQSNMFLYWNCLKNACDEGYKIFDFGRSSLGSSTYKFKEQWGAQPVSHYWHYFLNHTKSLPELNPQSPKFQAAIAVWRRLPLPLTRAIGPLIAKHLP